MPGTLYLIPSPLGEGDPDAILPSEVRKKIYGLEVFIVEHPRTARQFLKQIGTKKPLQELEFHVLDEHTKPGELAGMLAPLLEGRDAGVISEAGCPAVADPGADLARLAHEKGIRVVPLVGPSSILLALMASGLGGQRFAFHGYLPVDSEELAKRIRQMEKDSRARRETQIFIETPYRNQKLLSALLQHCHDETLLSIASDVTLSSESIMTRPVRAWKKSPPEIGKRPAVYLIRA